MTVGGKTVPAVVKFTIKASYNGKVEDTIEGIVEVKDISGTWVAPTATTLSLSDKSVEYNVSTGFAWNDLAVRARISLQQLMRRALSLSRNLKRERAMRIWISCLMQSLIHLD